jgi:hypothetical protein
MRHRVPTGLVLASALLTLPASRAGADHPAQLAHDPPEAESSLVPPWGRDLEEHHPVHEPEEEHGALLPRCWLRSEYLLWWVRDDGVPPLLSKGLTTAPRPGAIGQPGTLILSGDRLDFQERHGGRFTFGAALAPKSGWSVEAGYLYVSGRDVGLARLSSDNPVLARPFFDVVNEREESSLVAFPGLLAGAIEISASNHLQGAEMNLHKLVRHSEKVHLEFLAGFRWLNLDEDLTILEQSIVVDPQHPMFQTRFRVGDEFTGDNHFLGGQLGWRAETHWKRLRFNLMQKVALGAVRQTVAIRGRTVIDDGTPETFNAGLLALATNSGRHTQTGFAVVPEVAATVGLALTRKLTFFTGYSLLYWSDVARPGAHIDRGLNPNLIPTSATFGGAAVPRRPAFRFDPSDFVAHGVHLGLEWRY